MAATEARHSGEPKTNSRNGVSITVKGGWHGGGLLIVGGTLLAAAVGAAFAYHQSRANKKKTPPPAMPPEADEDFVNGDARTEHQSLIRNEVASVDGPAVKSLVSRSIEAVSELISEEVTDIVEVEQLVEMEFYEGEGTKSSVDEDVEIGEEGSDGSGLSLVESRDEDAVWPAELIDNGHSWTRHDVVCTGDPAVEPSASDVVEMASEQTSEELPSLATMDVKEVEMQVDMNIQEEEILSIIGSQGEGSDSSVDEGGKCGEEGSDGSLVLSSLESSTQAAVWPGKLIDDNCRKIRLAESDARMELILHDQVVSADIFKAASEPVSEESPTTDYVKEVEQLVELYLEEGSIPPTIGSKREGIDSSIDQSSTKDVCLEESINQKDKSLAIESKEKEEAQQYFPPTTSAAANNESSVTKIVKGTSWPFMEESPAAVDIEETEQVEMNCEEGQIPSAAEAREAVWLADLIDEVKKSSATELQEKEEPKSPKQYVLSTASQSATEESSLSEIVKAASEPNMEELLATDDVKEIEQQVNMNHRETGILQITGFQGGITDLAIDQSSAESLYPAELIGQEDKSIASESPEKEESQQYVQSANQAATNESYVFELVKGANQLIIEESSFSNEVEEIEQTVEVNHGESKIKSIIGSREEGTDLSVDEEVEGGEVESDGTCSSVIESSAEVIWPAYLINEEERRPLISVQTEKEKLQEIVKLTARQKICTETFVSAATVGTMKMKMRNYTNSYSRALVMLLALILVLGLLSVALGDLLQYNHHLG